MVGDALCLSGVCSVWLAVFFYCVVLFPWNTLINMPTNFLSP